jgi:hypothetical protein
VRLLRIDQVKPSTILGSDYSPGAILISSTVSLIHDMLVGTNISVLNLITATPTFEIDCITAFSLFLLIELLNVLLKGLTPITFANGFTVILKLYVVNFGEGF